MRQTVAVFLILAIMIAVSPVHAQSDERLLPITAANIEQIVELDRLGHGIVVSVAWSPTALQVATAGSQGVWLYDATDLGSDAILLEKSVPEGDPRDVGAHSVAFSGDGSKVVSANTGGVAIWDTQTSARLLDLPVPARHVAISSDGKLIAVTGTRRSDGVWDASTGEIITLFDPPPTLGFPPRFSPNGQFVAYPTKEDGEVVLWDLAAGNIAATVAHGLQEIIPSVLSEPIPALDAVFSPDGTTLVTLADQSTSPVSAGAVLRYVHLGDFSLETREDPTKVLDQLAFTPNGTLVGFGRETGQPGVWDLDRGEELVDLDGPFLRFSTHYALDPTGTKVLIAMTNGMLQILDIATQRMLIESPPSVPFVSPYRHGIVFSPDGQRMAVLGRDSTDATIVAVWDLPTATPIYWAIERQEGYRFSSVAFGPDGQLLIIGTWGGQLSAVDLAQAAKPDYVPTTSPQIGDYSIADITLNYDGSLMATASFDWDSEVLLWDTKTWNIRHHFTPPGYGTEEIAFSPAGGALATFANGGPIYLWNVRGDRNVTLSYRATIAYERAVRMHFFTWSLDGSIIVTSGVEEFLGQDGFPEGYGDSELATWDAATGAQLAVWDRSEKWGFGPPVFLADGRSVLAWVGAEDECARIYDAETGEHVAVTAPCPMDFYALSPDGTRLIVASRDGSLRLWGVPAT